jgi:hypothetical protein
VDNDGDGVVDEPGEARGDARPPDTAIDAGPDVLTSSASATFTFASSTATGPSSGASTALS